MQAILSWLVITGLLLYEHRSGFRISGFVILCAVLTFVGHALVGECLGYYYKSKIYDRFLHLVGSFSFALLGFLLLDRIVTPFDGGRLYASLFVITLGISLSTLLEIAEFVHDSVSNKTKSQHGLTDTDFDLIFNVLGAIVAGLVTPYFF